jgi:hypothetical protein
MYRTAIAVPYHAYYVNNFRTHLTILLIVAAFECWEKDLQNDVLHVCIVIYVDCRFLLFRYRSERMCFRCLNLIIACFAFIARYFQTWKKSLGYGLCRWSMALRVQHQLEGSSSLEVSANLQKSTVYTLKERVRTALGPAGRGCCLRLTGLWRLLAPNFYMPSWPLPAFGMFYYSSLWDSLFCHVISHASFACLDRAWTVVTHVMILLLWKPLDIRGGQ